MSAATTHSHPPDPENNDAPPVARRGVDRTQTFASGLRSKGSAAEHAIATLQARFDGREPWPSQEESEREWLRQVGPIAAAAQHSLVSSPRKASQPEVGIRIAEALERIAEVLSRPPACPSCRSHNLRNAEDRDDPNPRPPEKIQEQG